MVTTYRLRLDERAFRTLVAGRTVLVEIHHVPVEVVLDNVDWTEMLSAVLKPVAERIRWLDSHPPDPPEAREFLTPRRK